MAELLSRYSAVTASRAAPAAVSRVAMAQPVRSFPAAQCTSTLPGPAATVRSSEATERWSDGMVGSAA